MPEPPESTNGMSSRVPEYLAIGALVVSAIVTLTSSWRKWPDPIIDAGHQLYTAWRLSEGAVLYRDVGCLYGPLSSYWNALLFRIFGPGMMVLVWANLMVYLAITVLAYRLFRAAYGSWAALASMSVFIWVFSFNQLIPVGNCTYALPYAHESTRGVLLSLGLISVAHRWIAKPEPRRSFVLGFLSGLSIVLRPEFMLLSALVVGCAVLLRVRSKRSITAIEITL
jgi:hypothetical protein